MVGKDVIVARRSMANATHFITECLSSSQEESDTKIIRHAFNAKESTLTCKYAIHCCSGNRRSSVCCQTISQYSTKIIRYSKVKWTDFCEQHFYVIGSIKRSGIASVSSHSRVWLYRISCWEMKAIIQEAICKCTRNNNLGTLQFRISRNTIWQSHKRIGKIYLSCVPD